jgi:hypothetical protein
MYKGDYVCWSDDSCSKSGDHSYIDTSPFGMKYSIIPNRPSCNPTSRQSTGSPCLKKSRFSFRPIKSVVYVDIQNLLSLKCVTSASPGLTETLTARSQHKFIPNNYFRLFDTKPIHTESESSPTTPQKVTFCSADIQIPQSLKSASLPRAAPAAPSRSRRPALLCLRNITPQQFHVPAMLNCKPSILQRKPIINRRPCPFFIHPFHLTPNVFCSFLQFFSRSLKRFEC